MSMDAITNVVQMVFDGNSFEKDANRTIEVLDKLKESLNFEGVVKGLDNIAASMKDVGTDTFYNGVYKIQDSFNALDVVATRVLQNITDKIQNVATNLAKEITVAPLKSGLEEYETQINSVQTILANTNDALIENGLTTEHDRIEKINGVLDDLNSYADMTIYNFTEMTRNIGTFTAAGVELDKSANAIKGIANLAAMSGSNSEQASRAMYQLSQALSTGTLKLQDWNSVVNAGMGGKLFQNELIDTAKTMGIVAEVTKEVDKLDEYGNVVLDENGQAVKKKVKETINDIDTLIEHEGSFRESLASGWITDEILLTTLEKFTAGSEGYTKAQIEQMKQMWKARGYSQTMIDEMTSSLKILNDEEEQNLRTKWAEKGFSDEQIEHILNMGTAATDAATKVKTFSQLLDTTKEALQSGWTQSWEYIIGDFEQAKRLWTEISDIFGMYIGKSADSRNKVLEEWSKAAYSYNEAGELIYAADGKVVEGGKMVAKEMGGRELVIQGLRNVFQGLMEAIVYFREIWNKVFVNGDFGKGKTRDSLVITGELLIDFSRKFHDFTETFKKSFGTADNPSELLTELGKGFTFFAKAARHAYDGIAGVFSGLKAIFKALFDSDIFSTNTFITLGKSINSIAKRFEDFGQAIRNNFAGPAETASKNLDGLTRFFNGFFKVFSGFKLVELDIIKYGFDAIGKIFEHLIGPGETIASLLGKLGDKMSIFGDAFSGMFKDDNGSKIERLFNGLADSFNSFIDIIKRSVDFSGFGKIFDSIIKVMTSDKINLFDAFGNALKGLFNILKAFLGIVSPIAAAFASVFGDWIFKAAEGITTLVDRFLTFTQKLIPSTDVMSSIQRLFTGIFKVVTAVADVIGNVLLGAWDGITKIISDFLPDGRTLATTFNDWGNKLTAVSKVIEALVSGDNGAPKLSDIIGKMADKFTGFFGSLKDVDILEKVNTLFEKIGNGIKQALGGTDDMTLLDTIIDKIQNFLQRFRDILSDENGELDAVKVLEAGGIGAVIFKLIDFFKSIKDNTNIFTGFLGVFKQIGDAFSDLTETLGEKFKADMIGVIARSLLEIAAALFIIAMIDPVALTMAVATIAGIFDLIDTLLMSLKTFGKDDAANLGAIAGIIQTLGNSILMMAGAIAIIGNMEIGNAVQGLVAIALMMQMMVKVVKELSKIEGSLPKVAGTLIGLAIALNLLIIPIKVLGAMDLPSLAQGLVAVAAMMAALVGAAIALSKWGKDFKASTAFGLILMAESIKILASAVLMVKDVPWPDLAKGLAVMAAALIGMVGATVKISKAQLGDDVLMLGASLLMLGTAMMMLTASAKGLEGISWPDLGKLAAVLAGALIALGYAAAVINGPNLVLIGSGVLMVAKAIALLVGVLMTAQVLGPICRGIGAGLQGISESLVSFAHHAAAQEFLQFLKDAILLLPQLAVGLAQAIVALIAELGNSIGKIVEAVVQIGKGILQGIQTLVPELFNVIRSILDQIIQLAIDEIPKLFQVLTIFFTQLWTFLTGQIPNFFIWLTTLFTNLFMFIQTEGPLIINTVKLLIDVVLQAIIAEAPRIGETVLTILNTMTKVFFGWLTTVFTNLFTFVQTEGPLLINTIKLLIDTVLQAVIAEAPRIGETILTILNTVLTVINTAIPAISATIISLILSLLEQLALFVPQMTQAAMDIIVGFLDGIAQNIGRIVESATNIAVGFMDGIAQNMPRLVDSAFKMIIGFIDGLATAIEKNHQALFDAVGHLIQAIFEAIVDGIKTMAEGAGKLIGGFLDEFDGEQFIKDVAQAGVNLVQGIIDGIGQAAKDLWDAATNLANEALARITGAWQEASPSKKGIKIGNYLGVGLSMGIDKSTKKVADSASSVANAALEALSLVNDMDDIDANPVISPVFDMSNIQNGIGLMNEAFAGMNTNAAIDFSVNRRNREDILSDLAAQNAKSLSKVMKLQSEMSQNPNKLEINVYGTSSPDDVANAVGQKVRLLGLV